MRILNLVACIAASAALVRAGDSDVLLAGRTLAAALTKNGLPSLDSLTGDELISALSTVSADGLKPNKKGMVTLPQCFGRTGGKSLGGQYLNLIFAPLLGVYDDTKCTLNGLLALLPEAQSYNSAFTDMIVGPIAWSKFMMQTFGTTSCSDIPKASCSFAASKGACTVGRDDSCTDAVYSAFLFPLFPKYTCSGSLADGIAKCWRQASLNDGVCDGACAPLPEETLTGLLGSFGLFEPFANDPALSCWPKFNESETAQVTGGFTSFLLANMKKINKLGGTKNPLPWNYPAAFTDIFSTNDETNGVCEGDRAAMVMFFDIVSLQKNDQSWMVELANECDSDSLRRPFTAKRCKKIGSRYTFDTNNITEMIPDVPFDTTVEPEPLG